MKYTLLILLASATASFATVITVGNGRGPVATQEITNNAGDLVGGFAAFGIIDVNGINGADTMFADLSFQDFGSNEAVLTPSTLGQFSLGTTPPNINPEGTPFDGEQIVLLAGFGGTDLASSNELFIVQFDQTFVEQPTPIALIHSSDPSTILLGTDEGGTFAAATIAAIPEPSAALLAGLALVGGLVRRRR